MRNLAAKRGIFLYCLSGLMLGLSAPLLSRQEKPNQFLTSQIIKTARFFSKNLGYAQTSTNLIFKYENGRWSKIDVPDDIIIKNVFFVLPRMFWVTSQLPTQYREEVFLYRDGKWQKATVPHSNNLLDMAFSDENHGWAVGEWGELLKYENGQWFPIRPPTRCHIWAISLDSLGLPLFSTDCQVFFQTFGMQKNATWRAYPELAGRLIYHLSAISPDFFYFLDEQIKKLFVYKSGNIVELPFEKVKDFALIPPDSLYLLADNALYLAIDSLKQRVATFTSMIPGKVTASPDGGVWIYSGINGIYPISLDSSGQILTNPRFSFHKYFSLKYTMGAAYLQITPNRSGIYIVNDLQENGLLLIQGQELEYMSAEELGLRDPFRTASGRRNFDFAALAADFNNDGREDLFVTGFYGKNCLFLNLGDGKFKDVSCWAGFQEIPDHRYGIAATADVDNDGNLDIFVPNEYGQPLVMMNNGVGRFADAGRRSGVDIPMGSKAGAFADINGDGWIDLAVATYGEGTYLFRNRGDGTFEDIRAENPVLRPARPEKCPSLTFADYDNDGDFDLLICKLYYPNQLLQNDGTGHFIDVTTKAGLSEKSDSRGATFLDFDLDGDLDLFVTNMGVDRLYDNEGARFVPSHKWQKVGDPSWLPAHVSQALYGGFSSGTVKMDFQQDGDLDLLIFSFDQRSYLLKNETNSSDFLAIEPVGVKSNRCGIGTVALLYPEGHAGDARFFLGTQMIESTSAYASHSQKLLHFGVDSKKRYDVVIRFPGGSTRVLRSLTAGRYYRVEEAEGRTKLAQGARHLILNLLFGFRAQLNFLQWILMGFLFYLLRRYWLKPNYWYAEGASKTILAGLTAFAAAKFLWIFQNDFLFFAIPPALGLLVASAAAQIQKLWRLNFSGEASLEVLIMKMAAFGHSQAATNLLNSLEFQLKNFPAGEAPAEFRSRFLRTIESVQEQVAPDLHLVIEHLMTLRIAREQAAELLVLTRSFQRILRSLHRRVQFGKPVDESTLRKASKNLRRLRTTLRELREQVFNRQACNVVGEAERIAASFTGSDTEVQVHATTNPLFARIPAAEFRGILNELVTNAQRAMSDKERKTVSIFIRDGEEIEIEVRDHGRGIPKSKWEKIFERDFSDRRGGGFGLHYARHVLGMFDGSIQIKSSQLRKGTIVQIRLKKSSVKGSPQMSQRE